MIVPSLQGAGTTAILVLLNVGWRAEMEASPALVVMMTLVAVACLATWAPQAGACLFYVTCTGHVGAAAAPYR